MELTYETEHIGATSGISTLFLDADASGRLGVKEGDATKFSLDRQDCLCPDAWERLDPVRNRGELGERRNVLSMQYVPGVERQAQTSNGSLAVFVKPLEHLLLSPVPWQVRVRLDAGEDSPDMGRNACGLRFLDQGRRAGRKSGGR
jgi:hypothetical protein